MTLFHDREKRLKFVSQAYIKRNQLRGVKKTCPWLPCHARVQDCTFCVCPFYPCQDEQLGHWHHYQKDGKPSQVWDCTRCYLCHEKDFAEKILQNQDCFLELKAEYLKRIKAD